MQLNGIQLGSEKPKELGQFYTKVFGEPGWNQNDDKNGAWFGWVIAGGALMVGPHSEVKGQNQEPARIMINLIDKDVKATLKKFEEAGAEIIAKPYQPDSKNSPEVWLATAADPDGNYIQISTPWEE